VQRRGERDVRQLAARGRQLVILVTAVCLTGVAVAALVMGMS
jgi:hypothetical protein